MRKKFTVFFDPSQLCSQQDDRALNNYDFCTDIKQATPALSYMQPFSSKKFKKRDILIGRYFSVGTYA